MWGQDSPLCRHCIGTVQRPLVRADGGEHAFGKGGWRIAADERHWRSGEKYVMDGIGLLFFDGKRKRKACHRKWQVPYFLKFQRNDQ